MNTTPTPTPTPVTSEQPTSLQSRGSRVLTTLDRLYSKARPHAPDFKARVFLRIDSALRTDSSVVFSSDGRFNGERFDHLILEIEEFPVGVEIWYIYASCSYVVAAIHAVESGDDFLAWDRLTEASYFLGWACAISEGQEITDTVFEKQMASTLSKAGTDERHRKTNEMKDWVYAFLRADQPWKSQGAAVVALETELKKQFGEDCLKDFEGTLSRWLRVMPGREQVFLTLKANGTQG